MKSKIDKKELLIVILINCVVGMAIVICVLIDACEKQQKFIEQQHEYFLNRK